MIVAVQKGMTHMKNGLAELGFDTVIYGEYKFPIDAIVCRGITSGLMMSSEPNHFNGVFLVDCTGKTPREVANILNRRLYTPLF
ncbi:MAG: YkuS family protein [Clostridia bacterium]|nr:YkuS family protein [Clostridia bacterium]